MCSIISHISKLNVNKYIECIYKRVPLEILLRVSGVLVALTDHANGYTVCFMFLPQGNVDSAQAPFIFLLKIAGEEEVTQFLIIV